jgi:hypothetical protein
MLQKLFWSHIKISNYSLNPKTNYSVDLFTHSCWSSLAEFSKIKEGIEIKVEFWRFFKFEIKQQQKTEDERAVREIQRWIARIIKSIQRNECK